MSRWAVALLCAVSAGLACSAPAPPNVILVVLDTTRADHLSAYGYPRDTTPRLASFAADAIRFERAYSTSSWTVAAHASLFTGLLPATHQATQENIALDEELETLAELLAEAGYETVAFSNNSWISGFTRLTQGFERVEPEWKGPREETSEPEQHPTNLAVLEWLASRDASRPFFLFINYIEPHWPYTPPPVYRERFATDVPPNARRRARFTAIKWYLQGRKLPPAVLRARVDLYDAEIAHLDATLGALLDALDRYRVLDEALVVVTSDHGENLGERGHQGHSFTLYDSTLRVPLLIRPPGGVPGGQVRHEPVQLTDVFATILAAAGVGSTDARVVGLDLLGAPLPEDRPIVAEYYNPRTFLGRFPKTESARAAVAPFRRRIRAIQVGPDKLIWGSDGKHELYDMSRDPGEAEDLIDRAPERARDLEARLDEIVGRLERPITQPQEPLSEMDEAALARLRALGYLP